MAQLYAICRQEEGFLVKHVQLAQALQAALDSHFKAQEDEFLNGILEEVEFTGDWTPEKDELLVIKALAEPQLLLDAAAQNAVALPSLDAANFENEGIKGLFTQIGTGPDRRLLIQNFGAQQILSAATKLAFLFDGNVFRRMTEPSFALGTGLVAIVNSAADVKFKSFPMLRRVLDVSAAFREATDPELHVFCDHESLAVADPDAFVLGADEGIRKAVHAIGKVDVLGHYPVNDIQAEAATINFPIKVANGRIEMPQERKAAKALLGFLLDKVYRGCLDKRLFITNSSRPL